MSKKKFKAESQRLLELMINSIYTHKEIFLREIISNASDAIDKLCYKSLTEGGVGLAREDFAIDIVRDKDARLLTVSDNGTGMTREEMERNLGTIAKSGSLDFKREMDGAPAQDGDAAAIDIIGQFGVGFYSAFMVSDRVTVISRAYGADTAWQWEAAGSDGYTVAEAERDTAGTDVIMHIKPDGDDEDYSRFLEEHTIASLVKKYSDYIRYPIRMDMEKRRRKEGSPDDKPEFETYTENETLNSMVPVWQRNKSEVTDEELNAFYKEKFFDYEDPLRVIRVNAEGAVSYRALLFIPSKTSYDYYTKDYKRGLQLYSSGVLIMDRCEELIPEHFRFVRGVVDSPDLSLNISRELLQHDRQLKIIAGNIEKKIRSELISMLGNEREKYEQFFAQFGLQLKYGAVADFGVKGDDLKDLLLFKSTHEKGLVTLGEYRGRMPEEQKDIYYATGESERMIDALPQAERIRDKGWEILYFTQEVDEFVAQVLRSYDERTFKSVNRDELDIDTPEEKEALKQRQDDFSALLGFMKETLGGEIKEARVSNKLKSQPVCLTAEGGLSFEMERYLSAVQPESGAAAERVLELNADHPVVAKLDALRQSDPDRAKDYARILLDQAKLMAGLDIDDPGRYSEMIFSLM